MHAANKWEVVALYLFIYLVILDNLQELAGINIYTQEKSPEPVFPGWKDFEDT